MIEPTLDRVSKNALHELERVIVAKDRAITTLEQGHTLHLEEMKEMSDDYDHACRQRDDANDACLSNHLEITALQEQLSNRSGSAFIADLQRKLDNANTYVDALKDELQGSNGDYYREELALEKGNHSATAKRLAARDASLDLVQQALATKQRLVDAQDKEIQVYRETRGERSGITPSDLSNLHQTIADLRSTIATRTVDLQNARDTVDKQRNELEARCEKLAIANSKYANSNSERLMQQVADLKQLNANQCVEVVRLQTVENDNTKLTKQVKRIQECNGRQYKLIESMRKAAVAVSELL